MGTGLAAPQQLSGSIPPCPQASTAMADKMAALSLPSPLLMGLWAGRAGRAGRGDNPQGIRRAVRQHRRELQNAAPERLGRKWAPVPAPWRSRCSPAMSPRHGRACVTTTATCSVWLSTARATTCRWDVGLGGRWDGRGGGDLWCWWGGWCEGEGFAVPVHFLTSTERSQRCFCASVSPLLIRQGYGIWGGSSRCFGAGWERGWQLGVWEVLRNALSLPAHGGHWALCCLPPRCPCDLLRECKRVGLAPLAGDSAVTGGLLGALRILPCWPHFPMADPRMRVPPQPYGAVTLAFPVP